MTQRAISIFLLIILVGCGKITAQPVHPTVTPAPTLIATDKSTTPPSFTSTLPTRTPQPSSTLLPTPKPYLIKISQGAGDGVDEIDICKSVYAPFPRFTLYEDGQLIFYDKGKLLETLLTGEEIADLLGNIEETGYFEIGDSFEEHYDLPKGIQYGESGRGVSVSVKGKDAYVHPELTQYLIQPIKDTVSIIQAYQPTENGKPYLPQKIELWTATIDTGYFPTPEPSSIITDWSTELPALNLYYIKLSESETETLINSKYFSSVPELGLFKQDGVTYWVLACPPWYGY